jgi:hypothetical protein
VCCIKKNVLCKTTRQKNILLYNDAMDLGICFLLQQYFFVSFPLRPDLIIRLSGEGRGNQTTQVKNHADDSQTCK